MPGVTLVERGGLLVYFKSQKSVEVSLFHQFQEFFGCLRVPLECTLVRHDDDEFHGVGERKQRLSWLCGVVGVLCVVMLQSPSPGLLTANA